MKYLVIAFFLGSPVQLPVEPDFSTTPRAVITCFHKQDIGNHQAMCIVHGQKIIFA